MATRSNIAASLRDRLKNEARSRGKDLQPLLEEFVLGRFFARLAKSESPRKKGLRSTRSTKKSSAASDLHGAMVACSMFLE